MKLIVGLGNPGSQYAKTRHNAGFMFLDAAVKELGLKFTLDKQKRCEITEGYINSEKIVFIKPQTYMNLSGESVRMVLSFYKINQSDMIVVYDDMDLETGKIRLRPEGTSGGHKGMQNIIDHLGNNCIKRIRLGISKSNTSQTIDYVIGAFSKEERITMDLIFDKAYKILEDMITLSFEQAMSRYN